MVVLCGLLGVLLSGCGGTLKGVQVNGKPSLSKQEFIRHYAALADYPTINARGDISLMVKSADKSFNINGIGMRWYLERGRGYELSVRPVAVMEAGRLSIIDDKLLVLDRIDKLYFSLTNASTKISREIGIVGIHPKFLEAIVEYTPFSFVEEGVGALRRMDFKPEKDGYCFSDDIQRGLCLIEHRFDTGLNLRSSHLSVRNMVEVLVTYGGYSWAGSSEGFRPLPTSLQVEVKTYTPEESYYLINFALSSVEVGKPHTIDITPPAGYRQVQLHELIRLMNSL